MQFKPVGRSARLAAIACCALVAIAAMPWAWSGSNAASLTIDEAIAALKTAKSDHEARAAAVQLRRGISRGIDALRRAAEQRPGAKPQIDIFLTTLSKDLEEYR